MIIIVVSCLEFVTQLSREWDERLQEMTGHVDPLSCSVTHCLFCQWSTPVIISHSLVAVIGSCQLHSPLLVFPDMHTVQMILQTATLPVFQSAEIVWYFPLLVLVWLTGLPETSQRYNLDHTQQKYQNPKFYWSPIIDWSKPYL